MRIKVLVLTGYYLPGYKSGGILRNVVNTIEYLREYCEFWVLTRDRDFGDEYPYEEKSSGEWIKDEHIFIQYLSKEMVEFRYLQKLLNSSSWDVIFLTSFFDPLTIKFLIIRYFCRIKFKRVIVSPFGEFSWASFRQKLIKKLFFIAVSRLMGLHSGVIWRVSSDEEANELIRVMSPPKNTVMVTGDLPMPINSVIQQNLMPIKLDSFINLQTELKVIFLSRISSEKNLDIALKILSQVRSNIIFDIYGPIENKSYWRECQKIITTLPTNIVVTYCGVVRPDKILEIFGMYDLFLFPSGGEAYGNVIAESLTAGTPVLVSQNTPWKNLEKDDLGWDINLKNIDRFVAIIEIMAKSQPSERYLKRAHVKSCAYLRIHDPDILKSNLRLFGIKSKTVI
jgi:glycosyltransferase involved in cell wall biosynthesis